MRANQRLTRYTILKTQGVIPLDDVNADSTQVNDL
jgi:hypothetical protein